MRGMRAAAAAIVMCVALGGVPVMAQSPSPAPAEWVSVSVTAVCWLAREGSERMSPPPYRLDGRVVTCNEPASDPRVSGTSTMIVNGLAETGDFPGGGVIWGDWTLEGPEGTWTGRHYGVVNDEGVVEEVLVATGDAAYEGWTYIASGTDLSSGLTDIIGVIYHGAPPPGFPVAPFPAPSPSLASE